MATGVKHLSRKEIRQPDRFLVLTQQVLDFVNEKRALFIAAGVAILVVLVTIWSWQLYKNRQNEQAAQHFDNAIALFQTNKHKEAIFEFEKVQTYRWSRYAALGHLYAANSYLALNDLNKAATAAQRFVAATDQNSVYRQLGLVTLGHIEELKTQCKEAIERYSEAEQINGALKETAVLGKGRCYEALGDNKSAIGAYQQYVKENPNSPTSARLILQVAELQTKTEPQPAAK